MSLFVKVILTTKFILIWKCSCVSQNPARMNFVYIIVWRSPEYFYYPSCFDNYYMTLTEIDALIVELSAQVIPTFNLYLLPI